MSDTDTVRAKYLGDTPVFMPDLAKYERPDTDAAVKKWEAGGRVGPSPAIVVNPGDVIPLDKYSATERSDFEIVKAKKEAGS